MPLLRRLRHQPDAETYASTVYGFRIQTPFPWPELLPAEGDAAADVIVRYGKAPAALDNATTVGVLFQATPGRVLLTMDKVARFLMVDGREVIIDPAARAHRDEFRFFLLTFCLPVLLHQRRLLPLHASAIRTPHGAVLFAGDAGAGKSTLLGALIARGYDMLADDVAALQRSDGGPPTVLPGYPRARLWLDSIEHLGYPTDGLTPVRAMLGKYYVPMDDHFARQPTPLHAIYLLSTHREPDLTLTPLNPVERLQAVLDFTFRRRFADGLGLQADHFQQVSAAANTVPIKRAVRPQSPFQVQPLADLLEADFRQPTG